MASGEALLFLDADTEIVHLPPAELALRLGREPLTLLAPQLRLGDGSIQDSPRRLPTVLDKWRSAWRIASGQAVATSDRYPLPATEELEVETVMAACWVLSRQLFERVGGFDERIFYSPEDLDWCLRCWQAGGRILYLSQFEVRHYASKLSHRRTLSLTNLHHAAGLAYFFAKHRYALKRPTLTNVPSTSEPDR